MGAALNVCRSRRNQQDGFLDMDEKEDLSINPRNGQPKIKVNEIEEFYDTSRINSFLFMAEKNSYGALEM